MRPIDYTKIFKKHAGKWIALKRDEKTVVAVSRSAGKVFRDAKTEGVERPILFKVPAKSFPYVGIV